MDEEIGFFELDLGYLNHLELILDDDIFYEAIDDDEDIEIGMLRVSAAPAGRGPQVDPLTIPGNDQWQNWHGTSAKPKGGLVTLALGLPDPFRSSAKPVQTFQIGSDKDYTDVKVPSSFDSGAEKSQSDISTMIQPDFVGRMDRLRMVEGKVNGHDREINVIKKKIDIHCNHGNGSTHRNSSCSQSQGLACENSTGDIVDAGVGALGKSCGVVAGVSIPGELRSRRPGEGHVPPSPNVHSGLHPTVKGDATLADEVPTTTKTPQKKPKPQRALTHIPLPPGPMVEQIADDQTNDKMTDEAHLRTKTTSS